MTSAPSGKERVRRFAQWLGYALYATWALLLATGYRASWMELPAMLFLPAILTVAALRPNLFALRAASFDDVRGSLFVALHLSAFLPLYFVVMDVNIVGWKQVAITALAVTALLAAALLRIERGLASRGAEAIDGLIIMCLFGVGTVLLANRWLPARSLVEARARVIARDAGLSRASVLWRIQLGPAFTHEDWQALNVSRSRWDRLRPGAWACVSEREGLLGFFEAAAQACPETAHGDVSAADAALAWRQQASWSARVRPPSVQRVIDGAWPDIDDALNDLQRRFERGEIGEDALLDGFEGFALADPELDAPIAAWLAARPKSYAALFAAALHDWAIAGRLEAGGFRRSSGGCPCAEDYADRYRSELARSAGATPLPAATWIYQAHDAQGRKDDARLVAILQETIAHYPADSLVRHRYLLAHDIGACTGRAPESDPAMDELLAGHPPEDVRLRLRATRAYECSMTAGRRGDAALAESLEQEVLASNPARSDAYSAHVDLASFQDRRREFERAIQGLQAASRILPMSTFAETNLGYTLERAGRAAEALQVYLANAERNDGRARSRAGVLLIHVEPGIKQDVDAGSRLLRAAADAGDSDARTELRAHPECLRLSEPVPREPR